MKVMVKNADDLEIIENSMIQHSTNGVRRMSRLPSGFDTGDLLRRSDTLTKRSITTAAGKRSK
jgi:hypothetical protein